MSRPTNPAFPFLAGFVCLDLVNTEVTVDGRPRDLLTGFASLVRWLEEAGALTEAQARSTMRRWEETTEAEQVWERTRRLREALRQSAETLSRGEFVSPATVEMLNGCLARAPGRLELTRDARGAVAKRYWLDLSNPEALLTPVAESAADLLCVGDYHLLRKCANPDCRLYFYDRTKNHRRRWCAMSSCGNRAKAARHRERARVAGEAGEAAG